MWYVIDLISVLAKVYSTNALFKHDVQRGAGSKPVTVHGPFTTEQTAYEEQVRLYEHYKSTAPSVSCILA